MSSPLFDLLRNIGASMPVIIAILVLVIAAMGKLGKENGAILIVLGSSLLLLLAIFLPIFYTAILPKIVAQLNGDSIKGAYFAANVLSGLLRTAGFLLIAIGTFQRRPSLKG